MSNLDKRFTRAEYLLLVLMEIDPTLQYFTAMEAIYSTALAHPEWDMTVLKTFNEWYQMGVERLLDYTFDNPEGKEGGHTARHPGNPG